MAKPTPVTVDRKDPTPPDVGPAKDGAPAEAPVSTDEHVLRLEAELRLTRQRLEATVEKLERANEELKSSNEEYRSIKEELQSANKELETSKQELQTVNEELQTVNRDLGRREGELARTNSDLRNLLESTRIATLFLDADLRLRNFTPASAEVFHLIETDVGRPVSHVVSRIAYPELEDDARKVLKSLGQVERETLAVDEDRQYLVRVLPCRNVDNFIAGVVVTFLDITGTARAEAALRGSERRFGKAQQLAGIGAWEWKLETEERWWSPVAHKLWETPIADTAPPVADLEIHVDDRMGYEQALQRARQNGKLDVELRVTLADGSIRWLAETGHVERSPDGHRMLGVVQDITDRKLSETRLRLLLGQLQHRVRNILGVVRSVVSRSVEHATNIEDLASHLDGRLANLGRTQAILTRTSEAVVDLEEVLRDEILAVAADEGQVSLSGPPIRLYGDAAQTVALALHELTTNAVKYGALAEPHGQLTVDWRVATTARGPRLSLVWKETGVRALDTRPSRSGFGRELLERGLPYELRATTLIEFVPGGVRATIELPLPDKVVFLEGEQTGTGRYERDASSS